MRWVMFLGRLLFGGFFLWATLHNVLDAKASAESLASHSVPYPELALALSTLLLTLSGTSIVLGFMPRIGLGLSILYLVPTTLFMHSFWLTDASTYGSELAMFTMNVALIGAALSLFASPVPWPLSVDAWLSDHAGFSGKDALSRVSRRIVQGVQQRLRPGHVSSRQPASSPAVVRQRSDSWIVRQEAMRRSDGSIVMRRVRAYFINA